MIFRAKFKQVDSEYFQFAEKLRDLAIKEYGCTEFFASTEEDHEIAVSYWQSDDDIHRWKQAADHLEAQSIGKQRWYESYEVQVAEIRRAYSSKG